jgi:ferredoxin
MPLTDRGRALLTALPIQTMSESSVLGCEIVPHDELCVGCGICATVCPTGARSRTDMLDVTQLLSAPSDSTRGAMAAALRRLARHAPDGPIAVPRRVSTLRSMRYEKETCLGCGACARSCRLMAIEAVAPDVATATEAPSTAEVPA